MGARPQRIGWALLCIALSFSACRMPGGQSPSLRYWLLVPAVESAARAEERMVLSVGPIAFPAYLKRTQYVERIGERRLTVSPIDRWGAPLDTAFVEVLAENLERSMPGLTAKSHREAARANPDYRFEATVTRFEVLDGEAARLDIIWTVARAGAPEIVARGQGGYHAAVEGDGVDAGVDALSRALAELSADVAANLGGLQ